MQWRRAGSSSIRHTNGGHRRSADADFCFFSEGRREHAPGTGNLPIYVLAAVVFPFLFEAPGVDLRARFDAHQDGAVPDAGFVMLDALFRDAPADQRADA